MNAETIRNWLSGLACGVMVMLFTCHDVVARQPADPMAAVKAEKPARSSVPEKSAEAGKSQVDFGDMVRRISQKLLSPADIRADKVPLAKFVDGLSRQYEIPFKIDEPALAAKGIELDQPISATFKAGTLSQALTAILKEYKLRWVFHDTSVMITAATEAEVQVALQDKLKFLPQFRALWKSELYFIAKVCQPTTEQLRSIDGTAAASTAAAYGRFGSTNLSPRSLLQEALTPVLKEYLKPEQLARYNDEIAQRRSARQAMVVDNLVAQLDRNLILSLEQREVLKASLTNNWDDEWCRSAEALLSLDRVFPPVPDSLVAPHLDSRQRQSWLGMRRPHGQGQVIYSARGFGLMGNAIDETAWDASAGE